MIKRLLENDWVFIAFELGVVIIISSIPTYVLSIIGVDRTLRGIAWGVILAITLLTFRRIGWMDRTRNILRRV